MIIINGSICFNYLEDLAEWLERRHNREINIAEELESQIISDKCEFEIDGVIALWIPGATVKYFRLQTIARGDNDFNCEIGKDAIKIEYINNKKLFGPHLLVSKKKADEKFNIKRQITKKEEKERIVVNFTEQEKILCDILDEKK